MPEYVVTYDVNGESIGKAISCKEGYIPVDSYDYWTNTYTLPDPSERYIYPTGYTCVGWSKNSSATSGSPAGTVVNAGTTTWYAIWQLKKYTVTYNANGGTGAPASQTKTYGVNLTLSSTRPTRTGHTFRTWETVNATTTQTINYAPGATYTVNANLTLKAVWDPHTYTVTYNANGGSGAPANQTKTYGVNLTLSSTEPTRAGYTFGWWNTQANGGGSTYYSGDTYSDNAAVTLYAIWVPNPDVTVIFNANGGTGAPASQTAHGGMTITLSNTKPTKANATVDYTVTYEKVEEGATISKSSDIVTRTTQYTFKNWNTKADGSGDSYSAGGAITLPVMPPATIGNPNTITLYAIYTDSTTGSAQLPTGTLDQMSLYGWSKSQTGATVDGTPGGSYVPTSNTTLYALWRANGYGGMLKFEYDGDGSEFGVGTKVRLNGLKDSQNEDVYTIAFVQINQDGTISMYFEEDFKVDGEQNAEELNLEILTEGVYVPDMDYICSLNNRLFGCSTRLRTVYGSALGDPTDFYRFQGNSEDSYQVGVGSAGDFTGCCAINNSVYFFKANCIHKLMGTYPAEYALYTYDYDGVSPGNYASLVVCDSTAIFVTERGIGTYAGAATGSLSKALGEGNMYNAVAGFNGNKYAVYFKDGQGNGHGYAFDLRYGIWLEEDDGEVLGYAHLPGEDYMLIKDAEQNAIYKTNTGMELDGDWDITYRDFIEMATGSYRSQSMIFEKKRYTSITFRLELPVGSWIEAQMRFDGGAWRPAARLKGCGQRVVPFKILTPRCDRMQLRLHGHGPMKIIGMEREFTTGSRR